MIEHQVLDSGLLRDAGGVFGRGVVRGNVGSDPGHRRPVVAHCGVVQHGHHRGLQAFVEKDVDSTREFGQRCRGRGIAAEHDGAAAIIKTVAHSRKNRAVSDRECRDRQPVLLQYHQACIRALRQREGASKTARAGRWHGRFAMVGNAVRFVQSIGFIEALDDRFDALRSDHLDRILMACAGPALEHHFAQAADVVGVEMREENCVDQPGRQAHQRHLARRTLTRIDDVDVLSGDDENTRAGSRGIRQW